MKSVGILIFDDVEELDFAGPYEVFGMAARFGADCRLLLIAEERKEIRCRYGLRVLPDAALHDTPPLGILIVPGGLGARTHARANPKILNFVRQQGGMVASVCTGALILASAGILDGLTATTHHRSLDLLRQHPNIAVRDQARFIIHDRVATSAGVSAGIDLALALVARDWGQPLADEVAGNLEWPLQTRSYSIRRATPADSEAILSCLRAAFAPYQSRYTPDAYQDTVLTPKSLQERMQTMSVFVAESGGEIIGTIACNKVKGEEGHLRGMAVRSDHQGKDVAAALLEKAEAELREAGCIRITLDTTEPLRRAVRFYEKHGFRKSGRLSDFFGMPLHEYVKAESER